MNFKAAIFDMDGLLIDSMIHWIEADHEFLKPFGIKLTEEMITYFSGRSELENMKWLKEEFKLTQPVEELRAIRTKSTDLIYSHKTIVLPGVHELLNKIKQAGLKIALASGAPDRHIQFVIDRFEWREHFSHIISSDHVNFVGKPDPVIYLHTAERMGVAPADCVVFEDAENGIVSAKRAGMKCIAIPNPRWSFGDFTQADLITETLEDERILKFIGL